MSSRQFIPSALVLVVFALGPMPASGWSGTDQVAWPAKKVFDTEDWPRGVLGVVNDRSREAGWNPWFSDWPNDTNYYELNVRTADDVNRVVAALGKIEAKTVLLRLDPGGLRVTFALADFVDFGKDVPDVARAERLPFTRSKEDDSAVDPDKKVRLRRAPALLPDGPPAGERPPAPLVRPVPSEARRPLDEAALARRIEEYSDTKKGQERAAEDDRAKAVVRRFVAALVTGDTRGMRAESSVPWVDRAELVRGEPALRKRLGEYQVPVAFAKSDEQIALLASLEELEQALGKPVPEAVRKTWANHLGEGSRVAVVRRGPMLLGLSLCRVKSEYGVSGLLFDYFPKPDDPLLRVVPAPVVRQ